MKRITPERIYVAIEIFLFTALLAFQIVAIVRGYLTYDHANPLFVGNAVFQVSLTAASFCYAFFYAWRHHASPLKQLDFFPVYFFFTLGADVFFSFTNLQFMGHALFACAYLTFMVLRKAKWHQYGLCALIGTFGVLALFFAGKLNTSLGIDCFLGPVLIWNVVSFWIRWRQTKAKADRWVAIGLTLVLLSDLCIAIRFFVPNHVPVNHAFSLLVWPTYVVGNVLLNLFFPTVSLDENENAQGRTINR